MEKRDASAKGEQMIEERVGRRRWNRKTLRDGSHV
jgi:hypothetical protein